MPSSFNSIEQIIRFSGEISLGYDKNWRSYVTLKFEHVKVEN